MWVEVWVECSTWNLKPSKDAACRGDTICSSGTSATYSGAIQGDAGRLNKVYLFAFNPFGYSVYCVYEAQVVANKVQ